MDRGTLAAPHHPSRYGAASTSGDRDMTTHSHRKSSSQSWFAMLLAVIALMGCLFLWSEARADTAPVHAAPVMTAVLADISGNRPKALMTRDLPRAWGHLRPAAKATATLSGPLLRETPRVPVRTLAPPAPRTGPVAHATPRQPQPPLWLLLTGGGAALSLLGFAGARPRRLW